MKRILAGLAAVGVALSLSACDPTSSAAQPFNDAAVGSNNSAPADLVSMPDGFSNVATKCDHGNRVYTVFHGGSTFASVAVVAGDPTCAKG